MCVYVYVTVLAHLDVFKGALPTGGDDGSKGQTQYKEQEIDLFRQQTF